jgi:hypothetical protein
VPKTCTALPPVSRFGTLGCRCPARPPLIRHTAEHPLARRGLLVGLISTGVWGSAQHARADDQDDERARAAFFAGSSIVPALKVPQYLERISYAWPLTLEAVDRYVEAGKFKELSESLVLAPFDDVRQAAFYIPYALAPYDIAAAQRSRAAYDDFLEDTKRLFSTAQAAAAFQGEEEDVIAAFQALSGSLNNFLQAVQGSGA